MFMDQAKLKLASDDQHSWRPTRVHLPVSMAPFHMKRQMATASTEAREKPLWVPLPPRQQKAMNDAMYTLTVETQKGCQSNLVDKH